MPIMGSTDQQPESGDIASVIARKVRWRLGVPVILFMLLSSLDRVNISFAAFGMNQELGLSPSQYGFGAGVMFVGFLAGQYPSVLLLQRIGMGRWISACAVIWALSAGGIAFAHSPLEFYALRITLGLAEGGLAPGIVLYLCQFAGERRRAMTFSLPMLAIPLSVVLGSPISGWLMSVEAPLRLAPWRWMLIAEAAPALMLGIMALFYFPDGPRDARWLSSGETSWLQAHAAIAVRTGQANDWRVLRQPMVWVAALVWFCLLSGSYGIIFWLPQVVKPLSGLSPAEIGWVNALPWLGAMAGMYYNSAHSDRSGERFWHIAVPSVVASIATLCAWSLGAGSPGLLALFVLGLGLGAAQGAFWALPTALLTQRTLAVAAVAINITGSAGGLVMPSLVGHVREHTGGFGAPSGLIAATLLLAAALVLAIRVFSLDAAIRPSTSPSASRG
jgi:MFS transporter, ACS family, tartrate transporter